MGTIGAGRRCHEERTLQDLERFIVQLGAAMNASGQPSDVVQARLGKVARAAGADSIRVSAFPTYLIVTMAQGEPATLELTTPLARSRRLDQIAAIDAVAREAADGEVTPTDGLRRLEAVRALPVRFRAPLSLIGSSLLALGVCLVLRPDLSDAVAAAGFGALVGAMRWVGRRQPTLEVLTPVAAAFTVAALSALIVRLGLADLSLRAIVASLVVFLPGATLTTAVLELGSGQSVSGASRLVSGIVELALLAFGIVAGVQAVGVPPPVSGGPIQLLGAWAPWLGVAIFAAGVSLAYSAPRGSVVGLLIVLYSAWSAQTVGDILFGGYTSGLIGATVLTLVSFAVARLPGAMPPHASFLPGFWLLVPGAMGLIGLTRYLGSGGLGSSGDLLSTAGAIFGVALGVLCGSQLWAWGNSTVRMVSDPSGVPRPRAPWVRRRGPSHED